MRKKQKNMHIGFGGASPSTQRAIEQAYLAGVKAGRPKWHRVADGDYPPYEKGNYTINVLTDRGDIAYYNYDMECWIAEPSSAEIDPPVAWCEIPKYDEKLCFMKRESSCKI